MKSRQHQTALRPNQLTEYRQAEAPSKPEEDLLADEKYLVSIAETPGWRLVKEHINSLKFVLDKLVLDGISSGQPFDMIGQNTVATQITKEYLDRVIHYVEDVKQSRQTE